MICRCRCSGKCSMLGYLEQKIMEILWSSEKPMKPAEVLEKLSDDHKYTTIMTVLKRMSDKGIVKRELKLKSYFYYPSKDKKSYAYECLDKIFTRIFTSYPEYAEEKFKEVSKRFNSHHLIPIFGSFVTYILFI